MKTFTKLIFLTICYLLASSNNVHADDQNRIIRKDRVWESLSCDNSGTPTSHFFKFDGTEERDGKTYDRLIAFKKITYKRWPEVVVLEKQDGIEELHALIREEDGIVYSYIDDSCVYTGMCEGEPKNQEYVLYDFNSNETDTYESAGFNFCINVFPAYFHVTNVDYIDVGGEKCKRMMMKASLSTNDGGIGDYEIIEGIGFTEVGCLFYHGYFCQLTSMFFDLYFLRVFDLDGNILYGDKDWITPDGIQVGVEVTQQPSGRIVCDDHEVNVVSTHPCEINLVDMQGVLVASATGHGNVSLPLTGLRRGVYVATAESDGRVLDRRKILVK